MITEAAPTAYVSGANDVDHSWERTLTFGLLGRPRQHRLAAGQNHYEPLQRRVFFASCGLLVLSLVVLIASGHPVAWSL